MSFDSYNSAPNVHYLLSSGYPSAPSPAPHGMWTNYAPPASLRRRHVVFVDEVAVISSDSSYSYEDLLEMEERMGRVNIGLSEETISKNLKTGTMKYADDDHSKDKEGEICVVCQSEYESDETVATLHCGHCYHANCIKEWLLQKNVCPICKSTALEV